MRNLYKYQEEIYESLKDSPAFALFLEQGLGKTQIILHEFNLDETADTLIIIGQPNGLQLVWEEQIIENKMDAFVLIWEGNLRKVKRRIEQFKLIKNRKRILVFNIEVLQNSQNTFFKQFEQIMNTVKKCTIVIDQSACIKNPASKRMMHIRALIRKHKYKIHKKRILDGDPCSGGLHELYSQFYFLDSLIIGCKSYTAFKHKHCILDYFGNIDKTKYNNEQVLYNRIKQVTKWLLAKDCMSLPDLVFCYDFFNLSKEEEKLIKRLDTEDIFKKKELDDEEIQEITEDAFLHQLTKLLYKQQCCSGRGQVEFNVPSTKLEAYINLITKFPKEEQIVTFVNNHFEIKIIKEELKKQGIQFSEYHGQNINDRKQEIIDFINKKTRILIGTQAALGKGFTLTNATRVVFYSRHYSYRLYYESVKRVHRNTQKNTVFVHDLISTTQIEKEIVKTLQNKKDLLDLVREKTL